MQVNTDFLKLWSVSTLSTDTVRNAKAEKVGHDIK